MQLKVLVGSVALVACISAASAQDVKYEKYKLDNGMTVILHEDHALPVSAVNIWYRVGSKDERERRSGFAHLFEHLMFMGTKRVPNGAFDTIMEAGGGSNNASTASDRTNYFSHGPASLLPTLLWLDADRLEDLGRMMDQDKLNKQRDIVRNERRQSYENRPYGKAQLRIQEMMFPPGHPYHIPVIGTHEDLEAAQVADVKDFFATHYVPNNASLVVAGDFDSAAIKPQVAKLFGTLARSGEPMHRTADPVKLDGVKRTTMLDKVQLPMVAMTYHSPAQFKVGDAEMDLVAALLTEGKTSRLYKRLVYEDKIAVDVSAAQESEQLGSTFHVEVRARPDADLDRVEKTVDEEVARFVKDGPQADELERRKATVELAMLSRLQSIEAKADRLNEYEYFFGEPNSFKRDLDRYRNATAAGVRTWAEKVLTPDARVIVRVLPEAPPRGETPREKQPAPLAAGPFSPQSPQTFKLASGIPVMLWSKTELPLVAVTLLFTPQGGTQHDLSKAGSAALAAQMLEEGAGDLDALAFGDAMQSLGAQFGAMTDRETASVSLTVLKRNMDRAASLMADAVRRPRMEAKEWDRVKRLHLEELKQQDEQPTIVAGRVAARLLFGADHPYGWPMAGTPQTVEKLSLEDLKQSQAALLRPDRATLLVAGDVTQAELKSTLDRAFGDWKQLSATEASRGAALPPLPEASGLRVAIVNRPEAVQTVVVFIMPGPKYTDAQRVNYELLNTIFGGSFTSRLNQNLREAHGYTYGARSRFNMTPRTGYFTASSSVRADVTGKSLAEFLKEIQRIRKGDISADEATKARETLRTDAIQTFSGLHGVIRETAQLIASNLPFETIAGDMKAMQSVTAADLNKLADPAIPLDQGVLVLVGDKAAILAQIKDLKLPPPTEYTPRGEPAAK